MSHCQRAILISLLIAAAPVGVPRAWAQCDAAIDLGRGSVAVHVPPSYDPKTPMPLVMLLHGYTSSGREQEAYMKFTPLADKVGFLYVFPNGTKDRAGNRFWNATDACCNFFGSDVDDSGYLLELIEKIADQCNVDSERISLMGHSNGGFMAYRMACDHADTIASIASLAGATFLEPSDCTPSTPVHTLQIHGTADGTIRYGGGCIINCYPGAVQTTEQWATYDGCSLEPNRDLPRLDLDAGLPGKETTVARYADDCDPGGSAELWTIVGGAHTPALSRDFSPLVIDFLMSHPKSAQCTANERIRKAKCKNKRGNRKLLVKLQGGRDGDTFKVDLSGGQSREGKLNRKGKGKAKFGNLPPGPATATATFGCGAVKQKGYTCP